MGGVSAERLYHGYYLKTKTRGGGVMCSYGFGGNVKHEYA